MNKDLIAIFEYLEREKGIKREIVIRAIEDALIIAAKKSSQSKGKISVQINPKTGEIDVYVQKRIVDEVSSPDDEISLLEAQELAPDCEVGQLLEIATAPQDFGRIAAQAARQVIGQKLKMAEKDVIYEEYRHRVGEIISGTVKRLIRGNTVIVDLSKVEAVLPERNYPKTERYQPGERVQALLLEVRDTDNGGAEVVLSRSHPDFVKKLFTQEVPELADSTIVVERIVRDAGFRTKMAVRSFDQKVDPVGTCVGVRGTRIKNVIRELNNEKVDVIPFSDDPIQLLQNAISPVEILRIKEGDNKISIIVGDDDYPTVIGKKGVNARLIGKLVGTDLLVQKMTDYKKLLSLQMLELSESDNPLLDQPLSVAGLSRLVVEELIATGFDTLRKVVQTSPEELSKLVPGLNYLDLADKILEQLQQQRKG